MEAVCCNFTGTQHIIVVISAQTRCPTSPESYFQEQIDMGVH